MVVYLTVLVFELLYHW